MVHGAGAADAIVSSPPYQEQVIRDRDPGKPGFTQGTTQGRHAFDTYGHSAGQLGALAPGDFGAVVNSPPFEESLNSIDIDFIRNRLTTGPSGSTKLRGQTGAKSDGQVYGSTPGNIGNDAGDTFWAAARLIVAQVYQVLAPGAPAIWVVKAFIRAGRRVDFPDQWGKLCQSCGFELVHQHRAWLVEDRGAQFTLDNGLDARRVERKSFFRRLAEKRGSPRIDWETVLCMRKP